MDFELDFSSENSTMTSFLELEQEIREAPLLSEPLVRPSVIVKPRPTLTPSGAHHLPVQASGVSWPARQSRPSRGRSTPGPSHQPRLLPRPILLTRRRGRRLRTGPPPSGTGRRRKVSWTWPRKSSRLWRTRTLA